MNITKTQISGLLILEPKLFRDERGFFVESWNEKKFHQVTEQAVHFVQDNHSYSQKGVLRGLHYQLTQPQGKLVRVVTGRVLDVVVDLRRSSPTFGQHLAIELSEEKQNQFWIPPGFAHGFVVLSDFANFLYKTTDYYKPEDEYCIRWDDIDLKIDWQLGDLVPQISPKDQLGLKFKDAPSYP